MKRLRIASGVFAARTARGEFALKPVSGAAGSRDRRELAHAGAKATSGTPVRFPLPKDMLRKK